MTHPPSSQVRSALLGPVLAGPVVLGGCVLVGMLEGCIRELLHEEHLDELMVHEENVVLVELP